MMALFSTVRLMGFIDSAFLFQDSECIAYDEGSVYSTIMGKILEYQINKPKNVHIQIRI